MKDVDKLTDEQLFSGASESPGSPAAYTREIEIKRREYLMQKRVAEAQIAAAQSQEQATKAAKDTAWWTKQSAIAIACSVVVMAIAAVISLVD